MQASLRGTGDPLDLAAEISLIWAMHDSASQPTPAPSEQPWLASIERAAKLLDVSRYTVRRMIRDGTLESVRIRNTVRVDVRALDRWLAAQLERK